MIDVDDGEEEEAGAPAWMATFADLMSLLVCFFVLLLSFSELDVIKYKQIAGSMKSAFGVQRQVEAQSIPRGTSVVAREFSPGTPQPTPRPKINQQTTDDSRRTLQVGGSENADGQPSDEQSIPGDLLREKLRELLLDNSEEETLKQILQQGIVEGKIDIESSMNQITIRIREKGSFDSGQARLNPEFVPLVSQLRYALKEISGTISVEGHTDNLPIMSPHFESNWELSASRALSVARELMRGDDLREERFMVVGRADTRPMRPNDSVENRAANRRVEIVIRTDLPESERSEVRSLADMQSRRGPTQANGVGPGSPGAIVATSGL